MGVGGVAFFGPRGGGHIHNHMCAFVEYPSCRKEKKEEEA